MLGKNISDARRRRIAKVSPKELERHKAIGKLWFHQRGDRLKHLSNFLICLV